MSNISRLKSEPIYLQIAKDLKQKIISGEWAPGTQIPGENNLAAHYQTSRVTIRKSMDNLWRQGLIQREPGRGTFVIEPVFIGEPRHFSSFSREMESMGYESSSDILRFELEDADPKIAKHLGLQIDDKVVCIKRLRKSNNLIVCIQTAWLPSRLFPGLEEANMKDNSLYAYLEKHYSVHPEDANEVFSVKQASIEEAELLEVPPKTCVFLQERVTFTNRVPFEFVVGVFRGDRYQVQLSFNVV
jgi:GntR family transcriptional regulator